MKRNKISYKRFFSLLLSMLLLSLCLAGCTSTQDSNTQIQSDTQKQSDAHGQESQAEPVNLKWYIRFDDQKDLKMVNDKLNELTLEKINATVEIINIPGATYDDKMQVIMGGREECDIIFTGATFADFWGNAARGAFLPLNDLMATYGKETYDAIPEALWEGVKIDGEIYGVINYQIEAKEAGFYVPTEILEKYEFDLSAVEKMEDIEPLLEMVKQNEPDKIPIVVLAKDLLPLMGYDDIGTYGSPGAVVIGDKDLTVVNQYETQGFKDFIEIMRKWYKAGYIAKDAPTITAYNDQIKAGKVACVLQNMKPGGLAQEEVSFGRPLTTKKIMEGRVLPSAIAATLNCISSTSKNPEKAMEFLNLMNTDKEVYNLMCFGIEDVHYKKTGENRIELIENSGYQPNKSWAFGNQFNAYLLPTQNDTDWEDTIALNENSSTSDLLGFVFNPENVKNQISQCQSVWDQYFPAIISGAVDLDTYLPEFLQKLEQAGSKEIIAEKQKQIDAWKEKK